MKRYYFCLCALPLLIAGLFTTSRLIKYFYTFLFDSKFSLSFQLAQFGGVISNSSYLAVSLTEFQNTTNNFLDIEQHLESGLANKLDDLLMFDGDLDSCYQNKSNFNLNALEIAVSRIVAQKKVSIVAFGGSVTWGTGLRHAKTYPSIVASTMYNSGLVNRSIVRNLAVRSQVVQILVNDVSHFLI